MRSCLRSFVLVLACAAAGLFASEAAATVVVTIDGNTAHAQVSLDNGIGTTYEAEVTIVFETVENLSAASLNLTAELVDPNNAALRARLPPGITVPGEFPVLITVEPPAYPWLFASNFDGDDNNGADLAFLNTYDIEVHTDALQYVVDSPYRLIKAPIGGAFADITSDVLPGSVRDRGRGGAFSQFLVGRDSNTNFVQLLVIATGKLVVLELRVVAAAIGSVLRGDLLGLLGNVNTALVALDITGAIDALDQFAANVTAHAGTDIPNVWNSRHDVANDAGEMLGLAQTLRFTLVRMLTAPLL